MTSENRPLHRILKPGIAAVTLLFLGACATAPAKVTTLRPPDRPALQSAPSPSPASEETRVPSLHPTAETAVTPPVVAVEQPVIASAPTESALVVTTAPPDYIPSFASYYAKRFEGRRTSSGERYDPDLMTAATRDFPMHSWLKVINPANGREVIVRINDRTGKRKTPLVDLSRAAAEALGFFGKGKIRVLVIPVSPAP